MIIRATTLASVFALAAASPTFAQLASPSPFSFTAFGGAAIPIGTTSDGLNTGYTIGGAVDLRPSSPPLGFRLEGSYANLGAKGLAGSGVSANATDLGANLNVVLWFPMTAPATISPYVTGGPSYSRLKASASSGGTTFSDTQNHFGFNAGGGLDIAVGTLALRLDARYKRISTDNDSFQTIPVTVGIRF